MNTTPSAAEPAARNNAPIKQNTPLPPTQARVFDHPWFATRVLPSVAAAEAAAARVSAARAGAAERSAELHVRLLHM